jgi:hypothetical protein
MGDYPISQEFVPALDGYLTKIELKGTHVGYETNFRLKIKKGEEVIAVSDNSFAVATGDPLPNILTFQFNQTPFLEALLTYQLVIERLYYGMGGVDFWGDGNNLYYKIYGLTL